MRLKFTNTLLSLACASFITVATPAFAEDIIEIVVTDDANIFALFDDRTPTVVNYFSSKTELDLIDFYISVYGDYSYNERRRGRLTLYFYPDDLAIRVVISKQNNKQQVDIIADYFDEITMLIPVYEKPEDAYIVPLKEESEDLIDNSDEFITDYDTYIDDKMPATDEEALFFDEELKNENIIEVEHVIQAEDIIEAENVIQLEDQVIEYDETSEDDLSLDDEILTEEEINDEDEL